MWPGNREQTDQKFEKGRGGILGETDFGDVLPTLKWRRGPGGKGGRGAEESNF